MTKLEILEETIKFYSEDISRRSVVKVEKGTSCVYNSSDGRHCAVGRCFTPELKALGEDFKGNFDNTPEDLIRLHTFKSMDDFLEERYKGHSTLFWQNLQTLHDVEDNWDDQGLTDRGKIEVGRIKSNFKLHA